MPVLQFGLMAGERLFLEYNLAGDNGCMDRIVAVEQNQVSVFSRRDDAFFVLET
jgi:hypothetical protein